MDSANALTKRVSKPLGESLSWLKEQARSNKSSFIQCAAVGYIAASSKNEEIFHWLKELAINGSDWGIRAGAVDAISAHSLCKSSEIFDLLKYLLENDSDWGVRRASIQTLSKNFSDLPEAFNLLCQATQNDPFLRKHAEQDSPRLFSLSALLENYPSHEKTHELLRNRALNDSDEQLREWANQQLDRIKQASPQK